MIPSTSNESASFGADPSFRVASDEESGQTIISGMGELHLDVLVDRMKREFSVEANIPYKAQPQSTIESQPLPESIFEADNRANRAAVCEHFQTVQRISALHYFKVYFLLAL